MNNTILNKLKSNWLLLIIIIQPILDIISYFQSNYMGTSYTWVVRIFILLLTFLICFVHSKNKKKLILFLLPYAVFATLHIANLYRINKLNIISDVKYFILTFQMPILSILLIDYMKSRSEKLSQIKKALFFNFIIISISIALAYISKNYMTTYSDLGIIGWFSSANTASMILCALTPWALYVFSNFKNMWLYTFGYLIIFIILYTNATRSCYLTLIASLLFISCAIIFSKDDNQKLPKIAISIFFICLTIFSYKYSSTFSRMLDTRTTNNNYKQEIENVISKSDIENIDFNNINLNDKELIVNILKTSFLYENLINIHGEDKVVEAMKPYLSASALSDTRLCKRINAKIEFNDSDFATKILGIGYSRIDNNSLDLENDITAIYYYYGYLGLIAYMSLIVYIIFKAIITFFKNPKLIADKEFLLLCFLILLLLFGGEYSGAFLRKSNANIYLSLYLVLLYTQYILNCSNKKKINNKKITFLLLHLGYGGIETSTINTANALSENYEVELISFYNLPESQEQYLDSKINVKYLYNGGPNKLQFKEAVKKKNITKILLEGFKALDILAKKKYLIMKEIINSDSFAIISTRYDFSVLLNKYGNRNTIKIAQEHHHHNSNKKYINILKNKYKNIDYLLALTSSLKNDYEIFLKNNKHTKILVIPNILNDTSHDISNLESKNIISIGRLHEGKRINELITIFSKLDDTDAKLYIIGNGDEFDNLKNQISNLNLENRIIMTGYLNKNEQEKYLLESSVFTMTSISEGLPMVLLEAMSFGIPCIAYKTDAGISDIISNNENGFIIENRNETEYINKLNLLLKDVTLRKNLGKNCIKTCTKYHKDEIIKLWNNILQK